jgi:hypothetical protein
MDGDNKIHEAENMSNNTICDILYSSPRNNEFNILIESIGG